VKALKKCPFEVKTRSKKVSPREAPDEKAGIALNSSYFALGSCHEARTPKKNAQFV
jgi:hypothetical protein